MGKFNYVLSDDVGRKEEGVIRAASKEIAMEKLQETNKIILSVVEAKKEKHWFMGKPSMSMQEKMLFVKNLSSIVEVGVNIVEGFEILSSQTKKQGQKRMFEDIIDRIRSGQSLANSLRTYEYIFSSLFINMIETGEESGNLEKVLQYLDQQLEKDYDTRKKLVSALIYPAVIVSITILMAIGIVIFIMPKITKIFDNFDMELPLPTRVLIGLSDAITQNPFTAFFGSALAIFLLVTIFRLKFLKPFWDSIILRLPIFGKLMIEASVARFTRTLNSLLQAGVPITKSLNIITNMMDNHIYKSALTECSQKVEKGGKLSESLLEYEKLFPMMVTRMIQIGEKTGTIEITTEKVAIMFEKEVDNKTKNLTLLLEPLLLVFMAGLVGGIALSIILPIYQLPGLLNQ